jgi:hypothetical protein
MHPMSTDSTDPNAPQPVGPTEGHPADPPTTDAATTGPDTAEPDQPHPSGDDSTPAGERPPGRIERNTPFLITVLVAIIVAAVAIAGLAYYRTRIDDRNAATAAAFVRTVSAQGATVATIECDGDICAAIIGNQAYTVLVQEDARGQQHFGVSAYVGP